MIRNTRTVTSLDVEVAAFIDKSQSYQKSLARNELLFQLVKSSFTLIKRGSVQQGKKVRLQNFKAV